jgi:cobalt/nickel transport system permease protein
VEKNQYDSCKRCTLPAWLLEKNTPAAPASGPKVHFIRTTLRHISEIFENELFCEQYAGKPLFLQSIDARVKLIVLLSFLVLSSFTANPAVLLLLAVVPLLYAGLSGIPVSTFLRRIWLYLPLLIFILSLPGASSLFLKGRPLFYLVQPGVFGLKEGLYFSAGGIIAALRTALRTGISLSFGFLLLLTTRWSQITGALASLRVPGVFVNVLNMAYRYIHAISMMAGDMMEARYLRTVGKLKSSESRRFTGHNIAQLFLKSYFLSEEVYEAMCCRGFTGKAVGLYSFKIRKTDWIFILSNLLIFMILIFLEWMM